MQEIEFWSLIFYGSRLEGTNQKWFFPYCEWRVLNKMGSNNFSIEDFTVVLNRLHIKSKRNFKIAADFPFPTSKITITKHYILFENNLFANILIHCVNVEILIFFNEIKTNIKPGMFLY